MELYAQAESCEYGEKTPEMIRDRLVVGIRDEAMSRKLQLDPDLTLETAKKKIRQEKAVREQQQSLKETDMVGIEEINRYQARWKDQTSKIRGDQRPQGRQCTRCGRSNHPKDRCPAKDVSCHRCGRKGHYSNQCYSRRLAELLVRKQWTQRTWMYL